MPAVLWWLLGGLGVGAVGGYALGVETKKVLYAVAVVGGVYYLIKRSK